MPVDIIENGTNIRPIPIQNSNRRPSSKAEGVVPAIRLDLDDVKLVDDGIAKAESYTGEKATVDVYRGTAKGMTLLKNVSSDELSQVFQLGQSDDLERIVQMCFIKTPGNHTDWEKGNFSIPADIVRVLRKAGISGALLSNVYSDSCYWAKMGDQHYSRYDENGNLASFEVCYQYRCGWHAAISFVHSVRTPSRSTYFCINYPESAFIRLRGYLESENSFAYPDFLLDVLAADASSKKWLVDINTERDKLRTWETQFDNWTKSTPPESELNRATYDLHRLSREWLSICQDCEDFQIQLAFLKDSYTALTESLEKHTKSWVIDRTTNIRDFLAVLQSQNDISLRWTKSYRERTSICINLLFHLANQADSRTSKSIQEATAKVAKQTRDDSASMITIAAMTLVFLPGTFISSIMSTTFFNYQGDGVQVSSKWWILLPTILPLTVVVVGIWLGWLYVSRREAYKRLSEKMGGRFKRRVSMNGAVKDRKCDA